MNFNRISTFLLSIIAIVIFIFQSSGQRSYNINTQNVQHQIDINVYGQFLEHIYHSANGGLWGDLIWNRSFEMTDLPLGSWKVDGDEIQQTSLNTDVRLLFGETDWTDYEISLEAKKTGGSEGFLIIFRATDGNFYWCNLGGWNNTQHAIEKGSGGNRQSVLGNNVAPGSIDTDRWYNIRIRCVGNQFQVWIDDNSLFNFTDNSAHLSGQAGIGTWSTTASYRNIVATFIPSGDTIYNQIPVVEEITETNFDDWEHSANSVLYRTVDALNSDIALVLSNPTNDEAWIRQGEINLKKQKYTGSFWAKSDGTKNLSVKLSAGNILLAQKDFTINSPEWSAYDFEFDISNSTTQGTLEISLRDQGEVSIDQVSLMGQDVIDNNGFRKDLLEAVDQLQPPIIRWPGGCYASAYFWKDGIGKQHERRAYPIELWDDRDVNSYGTDEFMKMCEMTGAEPLVVVNTGVLNTTCGVGISKKLSDEEYLQDALDWMEYCNGDATTTWGAVRAANGHPEPYNVKYWEVDNEVWAGGINAYIAKVRTFVPAMREKYPDIKILLCGSGSYDYNWNRTLIRECADLMDYISVHHYEDPNNYETGVGNYENFVVDLTSTIKNSTNPNIEIYMSEWNVWSPIDWRSGLYAGGMLNMFERQGKTFTLGGPALWLRHTSAGAWNNAFINFNNSDWFPAPNYVVMKLWREHYAPNYLELTGKYTSLNAVATMSADSSVVYFKMVNTSESNLPLKLTVDNSFVPKSNTLKIVSSSSLYQENTMANPNNIKVFDGLQAEINGQEISFTSPGYSASVLSLFLSDSIPTGVTDVSKDESSGILYLQNYPNPFNTTTSFKFFLEEETNAVLTVFDLNGRMLNEVLNGRLNAGSHKVSWNGKDASGNDLKKGIYIYRLNTDYGQISGRLVKIM